MPSNLNINSFYAEHDIEIDSQYYDIVVGFFKKVTNSERIAEAYTIDLFRVAKNTNVPILTLLESIQDKDEIGINEIMAFYLNQLRPQSALLGVSNLIAPNPRVARNILG